MKYIFSLVIAVMGFNAPFSSYAMEEKNELSTPISDGLENAIIANIRCMENGYVKRFTAIPRIVQASILRELSEKYYKRNPGVDEVSIEDLKYERKVYSCGVSLSAVEKSLENPLESPRNSTYFMKSPVKQDNINIINEPNDALPDNLKNLRTFVNCWDDTEKTIKKHVSIREFPLNDQTVILNKIEKNIFNAPWPLQSTDFSTKILRNDIPYECTITPTNARKFKRQMLLGPLDEVYDQEQKIKQTNANEIILMGQSSSGLGNLMFHSNVLTDILEEAIDNKSSVLEIGAARGIETFKMLSKGAKVTAVDLSDKDISSLKENIPPQFKDRLKTIVAKFPEELHFTFNKSQEKFDVIYMSHVAHYLTGKEFRKGIQKIASWLKPKKGRFYFQTLTPYANPYAWNMIMADKSLTKQAEWPGYFSVEDKKKQLSKRGSKAVSMSVNGNMPDFGHPIHPAIMERELKNNGFKVLYIGYSALTPYLSQKLSPLSYQQQEAYVKRFVYPLPKKEQEDIENILKNSKGYKNNRKHKGKKINPEEISWYEWLNSDALRYLENYKKPKKSSQHLSTMDSIIVIACIDCDTE